MSWLQKLKTCYDSLVLRQNYQVMWNSRWRHWQNWTCLSSKWKILNLNTWWWVLHVCCMHSITESALCITSYVSYIWLSHLIQFKLAELTFKNFLGQASYLLGGPTWKVGAPYASPLSARLSPHGRATYTMAPQRAGASCNLSAWLSTLLIASLPSAAAFYAHKWYINLDDVLSVSPCHTFVVGLR